MKKIFVIVIFITAEFIPQIDTALSYQCKGIKNYLNTEMIVFVWNATHWDWEKREKFLYTYDNHNNLVTKTYQRMDKSIWVTINKKNYTYDTSDNIIERLNLNFINSKWENSLKRVYSYDSDNKLIDDMEYIWHDSIWVNKKRLSRNYDGNGNVTQELELGWNRRDSSYVNSYRKLHSYDSSNNLMISIVQLWKDSSWINKSRWLKTYLQGNKIEQSTYQTWDEQKWVDYSLTIYDYDDSEKLEEKILKYWDNPNWLDAKKWQYGYDENGNNAEIIYRESSGSIWPKREKFVFKYSQRNVINVAESKKSTLAYNPKAVQEVENEDEDDFDELPTPIGGDTYVLMTMKKKLANLYHLFVGFRATFSLMINRNGEVESAFILYVPHNILHAREIKEGIKKMKNTMRQIRFTPAMKNGKKVRIKFIYNIWL